MASVKVPIHKSKVLRHPLGGGQAGLLRETGLIDNKSGILKAWGRGIENWMLWRPSDEVEFTNLVIDETMQGVIIGLKTSDGSEMYANHLSAGRRSRYTDHILSWTEDIFPILRKIALPGRHWKVQNVKSMTHSYCENLETYDF